MATTTEKTAVAKNFLSSSSLNFLALKSILIIQSDCIYIQYYLFNFQNAGLKNRLYCFLIRGREQLGRAQVHCEQRWLHCLFTSHVFMKESTILLPGKQDVCKMQTDTVYMPYTGIRHPRVTTVPHCDWKPQASKQDIKMLIACTEEQSFQSGSFLLGNLQTETEFEAQQAYSCTRGVQC